MRFYRIQIDSIYLTSDGSGTGVPCKLSVSNVEDLFLPVAGNVNFAADGTPIIQLVEWTKGKVFEIQIETLMEEVWNDLIALILESLSNDTSFTVTGTGDIGDFEVEVKPFPQKPFSATSFINSRIRQVTLRFITI